MRGFVVAIVVLSLVVAVVAEFNVYTLRVLEKAHNGVEAAENGEELLAVARYIQKEKAFLRLAVKESRIDRIISGTENAAALWGTDSYYAAIHSVALEIEALKRDFSLNPF